MPAPAWGRTLMEVAHVICDLAGGGAERLVLDLCRYAAPGFRPRVVAVHAGGALAPAFAAAGVAVQDAGRRRGRPGARATARLAHLLRGADLIHTHLWAGDTWGRLAALARPGVPVVTTEHNTQPDPGAWRVAVERALAPRTWTFVAVSEAAAAAHRARVGGAAPRRVIRNGVDLRRFAPAALPDEPGPAAPLRLVGVGRLTRQKGFDRLLAAAAGLPVEVVLVGEGEDGPALAAQARALGVPLTLAGWQPEVLPWLVRAHAVVVPSRWEGFGLTAVEALAVGRPLLVSDADPLPALVGDAALVSPLDRLRQGLEALLDPGLRRRLAAGGPARAARWDVRETARAYEALYQRLVAGGRPRA